MPPIPAQDQIYLARIQRLLDGAYDHYFENSDGYHKDDEGGISVHFNNYFDRNTKGGGLRIVGVEIYSYVFGPDRNHWFDSIEGAYKAVKEWYNNEMSRDYEKEDGEEW